MKDHVGKTNSADNSTIIEHKIHHYEDHLGISHIKDKIKPPNKSHCITASNITARYWKGTKGINNRKINTGLLAGLISQSVNKSIKDRLFPENAQAACYSRG